MILRYYTLPTCSACRCYQVFLEDIAKQNSFIFEAIDIDSNYEDIIKILCEFKSYRISDIPFVVLYNSDNVIISMISGINEDKIIEEVSKRVV